MHKRLKRPKESGYVRLKRKFQAEGYCEGRAKELAKRVYNRNMGSRRLTRIGLRG